MSALVGVASNASLTAFAKLMAKKTAVESTANLVKSQKAINENEANGAFDALSGVMRDMKSSAINSVPIKLMFEQINAGTIEARTELMIQMLEALNDPGIQTGVNAIIGLLNGIIRVGALAVTMTADLDDAIAAVANTALSAGDPANEFTENANRFWDFFRFGSNPIDPGDNNQDQFGEPQ